MESNRERSFYVEQPHAMAADDVFARLDSSADGLLPEVAAERLKSVGPNRLPPAAQEGLLRRFFKHFELARTLAVNTLVCSQAFYLFNSRYLRESSLPVTKLGSRHHALAAGPKGRQDHLHRRRPVSRQFSFTCPRTAVGSAGGVWRGGVIQGCLNWSARSSCWWITRPSMSMHSKATRGGSVSVSKRSRAKEQVWL